jgi:hypothetical protein
VGLSSNLTGCITPVTAGGVDIMRPGRPTHLDVKLGYWRGRSDIHRWFVQRFGTRVDDCDAVDVCAKHLQEFLYFLIEKHDRFESDDMVRTERKRAEELDLLLDIKKVAKAYFWLGLEDKGFKRTVFYKGGY